MQRALTILAAALAGSFAAAALAQPDEPAAPVAPEDAFINQLDANGDGQVSLEEATQPQKLRFAESDTDGDGSISPEEAGAAFNAQVPPEMLEAMKERGMPDPGETFVKNLDANGDGKVDQSEFEQPTKESFAKMDANGDGVASKEEAAAFFAEMKQQMQEQMQKLEEQHQGAMPPQQQ